MKKYYYGAEEQEQFSSDSLEQVFSDLLDEVYNGKPITVTVIEMGIA